MTFGPVTLSVMLLSLLLVLLGGTATGVPLVDMAVNCSAIVPTAVGVPCHENFNNAFLQVDSGGQILVRSGSYSGCLQGSWPADFANVTVRGIEEASLVAINCATGMTLAVPGLVLANMTLQGGVIVIAPTQMEDMIVVGSASAIALSVANVSLSIRQVQVSSTSSTQPAVKLSSSTVDISGLLVINAGLQGVYQSGGFTSVSGSLSIQCSGVGTGYGYLIDSEGSASFENGASIEQSYVALQLLDSSLTVNGGLLDLTGGTLNHVLRVEGSYVEITEGLKITSSQPSVHGVYVTESELIMQRVAPSLSNIIYFKCNSSTIHSLPIGTNVAQEIEWPCNLRFLPEVNFVDTSVSVPLNSGLQALVRVNRSGTEARDLNASLAISIMASDTPVLFSCLVPSGSRQCEVLAVAGYVLKIVSREAYFIGSADTATIVSGAPLPSPSVAMIKSNESALVPIKLAINATKPSLTLAPTDANQGGGSSSNSGVGLSIGNIMEVNAATEEIVRAANIQQSGIWTQIAAANTSFATYQFASTLFASSALPSELELEVSLFDQAQSIVYAPPSSGGGAGSSNYTFAIDPSLAKLSISLFGWPWTSPANVLRFKIAVEPAFSRVVEHRNTPQARMTTLELVSEDDDGVTTTSVRLVEFAYADGSEDTRIVEVKFCANVSDSSIVIELPFFNSSLYYDPDFGVLLGKGEDGGGDDNLALIVAVSVAVPVAVVVVVTVVVVAVAIGWWRRRQVSHGAVNFVNDDNDNRDEL